MERIKIKNLKLKIISVVFSVILWVYVVAQMQISGSESNIVSLNYYNQTAGLQVSGPETVKVTVWGSQKQGSNPEITAYVDLEGLAEGVYELPVQILPVKGALLTKVEPNEVQVTVGSASKKNMEISYDVMTPPAEGYELKNVLLEPENCVVKGTEEALAQVSRVVAQLYLGSVYDIQEQKVRLVAVNTAGEAVVEGISIVPTEADATILVEEVRGSKMVPVTASFSGQAAEGHQIISVETNPRMVQVFGSYSQLQNINEISLGNIPVNGQAASFSRLIPVTTSENVTVYPSEIQVDVQIRSNNPGTVNEPSDEEDNSPSTSTDADHQLSFENE